MLYIYQGFTDTTSRSPVTVTVSACAGIGERSGLRFNNIYPNPSHGNLTIETASVSKLVVFNTLGEVILVKELTIGYNTLDLSGRSPGVYLLQSGPASERVIQKLIIH